VLVSSSAREMRGNNHFTATKRRYSNIVCRNVSEPLEGEVQTNQRAELAAILRALEIAPKNHELQIFTDSNYAINCSTVWYSNWQKNGWQTSVAGRVLNRDLVQAIRVLIEERETLGVTTEFTWIKGHSNNIGNEAADKLAVRGARRS
jgi:ribonuclease HI